MSGIDAIAALTDQVLRAKAAQSALRIRGGNTKAHLGCRFDGEALDIAAHAGVVDYEPNELVLTARAGTPLAEIEDLLATHDQTLGFEPPHHRAGATIGGTLACNLSGPARPWKGSVRDAVLGIRLLNGRGEHMRFGGRVIKNVAGFDVSRLQAGAFGALGLITEISLKVLPKPEASVSIAQALDAPSAVRRMNEIAAGTAPVTGAAWEDGRMHVRLAGTAPAVAAAAKALGGDRTDEQFWTALRDRTLGIFERADAGVLWRLSVRSTAPALLEERHLLIDWAGAQRFVRRDASLEDMSRIAAAAGGHAMRMSHNDAAREFLQQPSAGIRRLHERLKRAFDPAGVFNRGRLYGWL